MPANICTTPDCGHPSKDHSALVGCLIAGCECLAYTGITVKTLEDAHQERDAAMAQVASATPLLWKEEAHKAIHALAKKGEDFTPDDVWDYLAERDIPQPPEPRALGPILKAAASIKTIRAKGFTESRRRHGAPVRVYEAGSGL